MCLICTIAKTPRRVRRWWSKKFGLTPTVAYRIVKPQFRTVFFNNPSLDGITHYRFPLPYMIFMLYEKGFFAFLCNSDPEAVGFDKAKLHIPPFQSGYFYRVCMSEFPGKYTLDNCISYYWQSAFSRFSHPTLREGGALIPIDREEFAQLDLTEVVRKVRFASPVAPMDSVMRMLVEVDSYDDSDLIKWLNNNGY